MATDNACKLQLLKGTAFSRLFRVKTCGFRKAPENVRICSGSDVEFGVCGTEPCDVRNRRTVSRGGSTNTNNGPTTQGILCRGRLLLPCDLLQRLDFGSTRVPIPYDAPKGECWAVTSSSER